MAFTLSPGDQIRHKGTFQSYATKSAVTTTATQTLTPNVDALYMYGPTATISNFWVMADGDEGQNILIKYVATGAGGTTASSGDVHIVPSNIWPQSSITLRSVDDFWYGTFIDGKWRSQTRSTFENGQSTGATASGAIPLTVDSYRLGKSTGTDQAFTLADGLFTGQELVLTALTGTNPRAVTPATAAGFTTINMGNTTTAGATGKRVAVVKFVNGAWHLVSSYNLDTTTTDYAPGVIVT